MAADWSDPNEHRPATLSDTEACRRADELYGPRYGDDRIIAGRYFKSKDTSGLKVFLFAGEEDGNEWAAGYPEYVAEFFSSEEWGRCYADALEDIQSGGKVSAQRAQPLAPLDRGSEVAWVFRLEDHPSPLRVEVYVWTSGSLYLIAQVFGPDGELSPDVVEEITRRYADKVERELTRRK